MTRQSAQVDRLSLAERDRLEQGTHYPADFNNTCIVIHVNLPSLYNYFAFRFMAKVNSGEALKRPVKKLGDLLQKMWL